MGLRVWLLLDFIVKHRFGAEVGPTCVPVGRRITAHLRDDIKDCETRPNHKTLLVLEEVKGIFK